MTTAFSGFGRAAWTFLNALAADNTKTFFDRERHTYQREIAEPARCLVDALAVELPAHVHPRLQGDARVGRSLFRINRDTRFSADKTPYKTHIDFLFWTGERDPRTSPAAIMRITSSTILVGAGRIGLRGADLDHYRRALTDATRGPQLRTIVDRLLASGADLNEPDRVRAPRGYPRDHPNADLLRRDGFHLTHIHRHPDAVDNAAFVDWCIDALTPYSPLIDWLTA